MFRSNPRVDRAMDFFRLPRLYWRLLHKSECPRPGLALASDLLEWFFVYRTFPDNYGPCRLWDVNRSDWKYYYGSNYHAYQRRALTRQVQPVRYVAYFQNKANYEELCRHNNINMPQTYGVITPHSPYRERLAGWLGASGAAGLIVKPLVGAGGRGIVLVERRDDTVVVRSRFRVLPLSEFKLAEDALVQALVRQDARMGAFSLKSLNTIRLVTMMRNDGTILIVAALMRCGVGDSYVDNYSSGGVIVGVHVDTGLLQEYAHDKQSRRYLQHPTTGLRFSGFIVPEWDRIVETARRTQRLFSWYRILGVDVGLAENGTPVLIEVNASPDLMGQEQASGPLLQRDEVLKAFGQEDLLVNRRQRALYASLPSKPVSLHRGRGRGREHDQRMAS